MIGIITWGITSDQKCKKLLKKDDCIIQMVFSYYSKEHMFGNGSWGVSTGYNLTFNENQYKLTSNGLAKPISQGTPIIVRFSPECPDCYQFLWDSVVVLKDYKVKYSYIKNEGYLCEFLKN